MSKLLAGRYELLTKIGEGGMAVVYKAKDRLLNRYVAIKILRPEFTKDEQFVENFKRESQAAAGLQHPNIVAVYDVGRSGNINYIVMELIDGRPLSELIREKAPFHYKMAIKIAKQVAAALSLAHQHNIIHRDVKPHNIMITKDGIAKLTDFGIAQAVSDTTMVADTNKIIGSVHYFSPEQARGAHVDERSDIYSLGIVIYEMLTAKVPYDGENPVEVALKHFNEDMVKPSRLVAGIPPALEKLVLKATAKSPQNRFGSADELLEELNNIEYITHMVGEAALFPPKDAYEDRRDRKSEEKNRGQQAEGQPNRPKAGREGKPDSYFAGEKGKRNKRKAWLLGGLAGGVLLLMLALILLPRLLGNGGQIEVPDVREKSFEDARTILEAKGLKIEKAETEVASEKIPKGFVVSQNPAKGEKVKPDRVITVTLSSGQDALKVPKLTGKSYEEAKQLLSDMGLQITKGESIASDQVEKDKIAMQYPEAGTEVAKQDIITVNLSSGPGDAVVPKLVGKAFTAEADIEALLQQHGYKLGAVTYEESYETPGTIIKQSPDAGVTAKKDTPVDIVISKAKPTVVTPDLSGKSKEEAASLLKTIGLSLGQVSEKETGDQAMDGLIVGQNPGAASELMPGSTVDITIGKYTATEGGGSGTPSGN